MVSARSYINLTSEMISEVLFSLALRPENKEPLPLASYIVYTELPVFPSLGGLMGAFTER